MNEKIQIRKATLIDIDAIYKFNCLLEDTVFDKTLFATYFHENLSNKHNFYFIAEDISNSKIIGYISCHGQILLHHLGLVFEIQEMFVDDFYRNQGIGKALLQCLEESLPANCKSLEVTAQNKRLSTHEFYQSNGFKSTHLKFTKTF
jgi:PhnO protein